MCGTSRWKYDDKKIPWKSIEVFSYKTQTERLFMFMKMTKDMWCHKKTY